MRVGSEQGFKDGFPQSTQGEGREVTGETVGENLYLEDPHEKQQVCSRDKEKLKGCTRKQIGAQNDRGCLQQRKGYYFPPVWLITKQAQTDDNLQPSETEKKQDFDKQHYVRFLPVVMSFTYGS